MIQQNVIEAQAKVASGEVSDPRSIGLVIEMTQRYIEYLDELEFSNFRLCPEVIVKVDGQAVKFESVDKFADWLVEYL